MKCNSFFECLKTQVMIIVVGCSFFSCEKFVTIEPAPGLVETKMVFENDKTAIAASGGLYAQMNTNIFSFTCGGLSIFCSLSADEIYNTSSSSLYDVFLMNSLLSTDGTVYPNFWSAAYKNIYRANAIIDGLEKSALITDSVKKQLAGEMKVVRALNYFYLVNLFGDVPLVVNTDFEQNALLPRTNSVSVYQQIVDDLTVAKSLLTPTYPSTGKARPNLWTATALLARVYIFLQEWDKAEQEAGQIINSGHYSLPVLSSVFLKNSSETIWELFPVNDVQLAGPGSQFVPSSATVKPSFSLTNQLYSSFEPGDNRKTQWVGTNTISGISYYYPYKQKQRTGTPVNEYNIVFRLAEQYLIRAEARAKQNKLAEAQADLNVIRKRAGLANTPASTQDNLIVAIRNERRVEMFCEWGHRWLDLKRSGIADAVLSPLKGVNWQSTDVLYPIPLKELEFNPFLVQNPGY